MSTEQMKQCQAPATHAPAGNKMTYTPPQMEVIKMDLEGVIAGSGNLSDFTSGSTIRQSSTRRIEQRPGRPDKRHPHRRAIVKPSNHP